MEATRQLRRQHLLTIVNGTTTRPADTGKGQDDWDDLSKYQSNLPLEDNESQMNLLQHSQQKRDHGSFKFCGYCKKAGWPGTSHNEIDCKWKKRDANNKPSAHTTETAMTTTQDDEPEWDGVMSFVTTTTPETNKDDGWFIDSCATVHITNNIQDLTEVHSHREPVTTGGGPTYSTHRGIAIVHGMRLNNVLVIPSFPKTLINVGDITSVGGSLILSNGNDVLKHPGLVRDYSGLQHSKAV